MARIEGRPRLRATFHEAEYGALLLARALVAPLPPSLAVRLGAALGSACGRAAAALGTRDDRIARSNLARVFPDLEEGRREALRRAMWRQAGRVAAEILLLDRLSRGDPARLRELVTLSPPEGPREVFARAAETGAFVLTAHLGSFELLHAGCAAHGYPVSIVHRTLPNRRVDAWLTSLRERCGTRVLRRGSAAREILADLRARRVVAIPFDQRGQEQGRIVAPFLSIPAPTPSGLARIALRTGAPVFPVVLLREGTSHRHRALFLPEIPLPRTGHREADVLEATRRFNDAIGALIRRHPDQWIWTYRRWPDPAPGPPPAREETA